MPFTELDKEWLQAKQNLIDARLRVKESTRAHRKACVIMVLTLVAFVVYCVAFEMLVVITYTTGVAK
jgi:hypothetical protein